MTKPLLLFMVYALSLLDDFNTVFQGEAPLLYEIEPRVKKLILDFASNFMHLHYVRSVQQIFPRNVSQYVPRQQVYLGISELNHSFVKFHINYSHVYIFQDMITTVW